MTLGLSAALTLGGPASRRADAQQAEQTGKSGVTIAVRTAANDAAYTSDHSRVPLTPLALKGARRADDMVHQNIFRLAAGDYALAATVQPEDPLLREMAGVALSSAGMPDKAMPQFRRAVQLADDDVIATMLLQSEIADHGDPNEAQALFEEVHRRFSRQDGKGGLDTTASISRITQRLKQEPDSAVLWLLLGDAKQLAQDWDGSDEAYKEAAHDAPLWSKPLVNRGLSHLAQGHSETAILFLTQAIHVDPSNTQAKVWLGDAALHGGHNGLAITTLTNVIADTDVNNALRGQAALRLGQAYSNNRQYARAAASLAQAQRLAPDDPTPSALLGEVQQQAGNYDAATRAYQAALRLIEAGALFADRPILYRALAEAQISDHRPVEALETLRLAQIAEPNYAALWHRLAAQAQFDQGHADVGQEELCDAIDADQGQYPYDALNAIAARNLIDAVKARYETLLKAATDGAQTSARGGTISIRIHSDPAAKDDAAAPDDRARALAALADIARYQNRTHDEIALRLELTQARNLGADWFLLAQVYDERAEQPVQARQAYARALELKTGLSPGQTTWATKRLATLSAP